jgi:hypothetical protein
MKGITKTTRVNSAMQVIQHMNTGMTVVDACREAGVARSTFYDFLKSNPEAVIEIQNVIENAQREQLGMALLASNRILEKVIEDGLSDETKPRDRLTIFLKLKELVAVLAQNSPEMNKMEQDALEFLKKGPTLRYVESRFTTSQTEKVVEITQVTDYHGSSYADIIDLPRSNMHGGTG